MKGILPAIILILSIKFCHSQTGTTDASRPRFRSKENNSAPGHYELVTSINKSQINKGDSAVVDVLITGYGQIGQSKIFINCSSSEILSPSFAYYNLQNISDPLSKEPRFIWGGLTFNFDALPAILDLNNQSTYIDANLNTNSTHIITEEKWTNAPVSIHLRFKKNARADDYKLNFYFTYFNGSEWAGSTSSLDFRINSWSQKHETVIVIIGAIAAIFSLFPIFKSSWKYWKTAIKEILKRAPVKSVKKPAK